MGVTQSAPLSPTRSLLDALTSFEPLPTDFPDELLRLSSSIARIPKEDYLLLVRPYLDLIPKSPHTPFLLKMCSQLLTQTPTHDALTSYLFLSMCCARVILTQFTELKSLYSDDLCCLFSNSLLFLAENPDVLQALFTTRLLFVVIFTSPDFLSLLQESCVNPVSLLLQSLVEKWKNEEQIGDSNDSITVELDESLRHLFLFLSFLFPTAGESLLSQCFSEIISPRIRSSTEVLTVYTINSPSLRTPSPFEQLDSVSQNFGTKLSAHFFNSLVNLGNFYLKDMDRVENFHENILLLYLLVSTSTEFKIYLVSKMDLSKIIIPICYFLLTVDPGIAPKSTLALLSSLVVICNDSFLPVNLFNVLPQKIHYKRNISFTSLGNFLIFSLLNVFAKCLSLPSADGIDNNWKNDYCYEAKNSLLHHLTVVLCQLIDTSSNVDLIIIERLFRIFEILFHSIEDLVSSSCKYSVENLAEFWHDSEISECVQSEVRDLTDLLSLFLHSLAHVLYRRTTDQLSTCAEVALLCVSKGYFLSKLSQTLFKTEAVFFLLFMGQVVRDATDTSSGVVFETHQDAINSVIEVLQGLDRNRLTVFGTLCSKHDLEHSIDFSQNSSFYFDTLLSIARSFCPILP
ncbi:hypothetical protein RCL1_001079 [Eukaryota sp. TZLM3-RCL]